MTIKQVPKPEQVRWTDSQWEAISSSGTNLLVSAAAGSGKTAVLVERIIHRITNEENPLDVDELLIVTFTNAAAAEMKNRIAAAIETELAKNPESLHLRRQLALLNRAQISTLHAFCMSVIRKYYYLADIDPNFRILHDVEGELLKEEILEEVFEEQYSLEDNRRFIDAVDRFSNDRSDEGLRNLVLKLYHFSRSHPDPNRWLIEMADTYLLDKETTVDQLTWGKEIWEEAKVKIQAALLQVKEAKAVCLLENGPFPYLTTIEEDEKMIKSIFDSSDWETMHAQFSSLTFGRLKTIKKNDPVDKSLKEYVKEQRDIVKKEMNELKSETFSQPPAAYLQDVKSMAAPIQTLVETVQLFAERYEQRKTEKTLVDFSDLEHISLALLKRDNSEAAKEYRTRFQEILVDEFQDINHTQEEILKTIANHNNLFLVGDVKQSIYRFRLAEPGIFLDKYKSYNRDDGIPGWKINLDKNFRSRKDVLHAVNFIFKQVMDEEAGEIEYDEAAELKAGNLDYPDFQNDTELVVINKGEERYEAGEEAAEEVEEIETAQLEARFMARRIKQLLEDKHQIMDKETKQMRRITFRDIVILMRSLSATPAIVDEFKKEGLPVYAELNEGYFEAVEINIMLSLLKTIDNPFQDIPLAAVLRSPIVDMNEEELAQIRLMNKEGSFFEALKEAVAKGPASSWVEKATSFYGRFCKWRDRARKEALSDFLWDLMQETGYYDFAGGLPGGKQRQANLLALYDRARSYEKTSFRGLFRFLRFIERIQERGDDLGTARALGEQEDVIRMMTIHKSKGLEFPIVFLAGLNKKFNMQDVYSRVLFHKSLGIGTKTIDPDTRIVKDSLPQLAIKKKTYREQLAEEMRTLYVAMTRAKEKLILVGTVNNPQKMFDKWQRSFTHSQQTLPVMVRLKAKSYVDWIGPAVFRHSSADTFVKTEETCGNVELHSHPSKWMINVVEKSSLQEVEVEQQAEDSEKEVALKQVNPILEDHGYTDEMEKKLNWLYPFQDSVATRSKQTVSEYKRHFQDEYSEPAFPFSFTSSYAERPMFLQEETVNPAERGTAVHTLLEHIPLDIVHSSERVESFIYALVDKELLTSVQAQLINVQEVLAFFNSEIGRRLKEAQEVYRELPFSYGKEITSGTQDFILIQGTVDCVFRDGDGKLVLIDYKTDAFRSRFPANLEKAVDMMRNRYQKQIDMYGEALSSIWQEPIREAYLYAFDGGFVIDMVN
ncbi:helicase-exonuclease AddAB subunit AddA [Bacillus piscicola]|uniref:helicase-exonuclease AddAB subunit AddA n=1 Tax=Bacillus piscicola TaxID=1632684 RepID=UPI001F08BBEB|nr:helicase-exonuclease AddAB subunit AddA [Bacillus piscicola]